ncbi:hypothetical protein BS50DRAFT_568643 [Corynespora cassiicola Philippines]|uniref:Nucleoporin Nup120/160 n=1 Tax=Corynespora cassiicola Philippines TaxID=1448308 RepID=A0A2T2P5Q4_CORCC|nr:hypothetical protein BS50DRAFT_568643 [Corynespora cassiicola Philippines]
MVRNGGTCLYKEARLNIEPAFPGSTISITLPATSTSTFGARTQAKRAVVSETHSDQDDEAFAKRHLASDGSVFFRQHHEYPRSFLWRILDSRRALEIQAADLDHDAGHNFEANLTIILQFAAPIRPFCLAFADSEDRDDLTIFAITTTNELYTITLHRDFFIKPSASEQDIGDWCKRSWINLFQNHVVYRLVAVNANELLVSLESGGIVRLTRSGRDDAGWNEALYQNTNWSLSVRGFLPWKGHQFVRFDNTDLEVTTPAALAVSPDHRHILSVSLDHKLRAWNVETGRVGIQTDLLGAKELSNEKVASYLIGPSHSTLMAVINTPGGLDGAEYHVVTYSPKQHQFKFWGIRDADDANLGIYDVQPDVDFIPPVDELMEATVWTMEEFVFVPPPAGWRGTELWIRARSGPSSKIYMLKFDLGDDAAHLAQTWKHNWISVDSGPLTVDVLKQNPSNPSESDLDFSEIYDSGLSEQWLEFLFYPGRFTVATLETALSIFRRGIDRSQPTKLSSRSSLKERICSTVTNFATRAQNGPADLDEYQSATAVQWQAFYGLVKDLHKRRGESLSFVYDHKLDMPWLIMSDYLSAIRRASDPEAITLNAPALSTPTRLSAPLRKAIAGSEVRDISRLLNAAASFRRRLPTSFQIDFKREIENELLQSRSLSVLDRMALMEQNSDLAQQVSDEDLSLLVEELGTDVKDLTTETFRRAMQSLSHEEQGRTNRSRRQIARYGLNALVRISQETLEANYNTLVDLLVLILFMQFDEDVSEEFDASEIFVELVDQFKDNMILGWLARTVWSRQTPTGPSSEVVMKTLAESLRSWKLPITQTVLEGIYGECAFDFPLSSGLKSGLLTHWARAWIALPFKDQNFDPLVEDIMGKLLSQKEYELALDFSKFLPEDSWATYLKGRMHVALGENTLASVCFQKAAYNLALGLFSVEDADTAVLISELERNSFSEGLPRYYLHILGLFEKVKAYSYVADFARLGLRTLRGREENGLRTDLLQRLFTASMQTSRFDEAYSAMTRHSDIALKHAALQKLVESMVKQGQTEILLKFPFVGLADEVDAILASLCHKTLNLASGPAYHQILYSFRISRNDFRGAASILHERLQRLKSSSSKIHDPADESLTHCYLMIISALSCVGEEDAYILADKRIDEVGPPQWGIGKAKKMLKRQIITLDTLRKEYQAELDRMGALESGHYPFAEAADEMDIL